MSILQGSSGDRGTATEYLTDVCSESTLPQDWHHDRCQGFAKALTSAMSIDSAANREHFDSHSMCSELWTQLQGDAKAQIEKERIAREAAEAQATKEAERFAAENSANPQQGNDTNVSV